MTSVRLIRASVLLLVGCSSDAAGPEAAEPRGLRIVLNGTTIVRADGEHVEGLLHIHVGQYSGQFIISVVNGVGKALPTAGYRLDATTPDPEVATFAPSVPGGFEGEIVGHADGGTTMLFRVPDGAGGMVYAAPPVELVATTCIIPASAGAGCGG